MIEPHFLGGRSRGYALATAVLALGACGDPEQRSDLRPEGAPEVLTVMIMNDPGLYLETATFCKPNDDKRPSEVFLITGEVTEVCPLEVSEAVDMVEDALPTGWYVRIVFDELLDPDIEELIPNIDPVTMEPSGTASGSIANTHPVTLECGGVEVEYDGYYSPGGNYQTWPVGPSLVIIPDDPTSVAAGTECTVEILDNVVDKDGVAVPDAQRGSGGEYRFAIAPLSLIGTDPEAVGEEDVADKPIMVPEAPASLIFNTVIDPASITTADVLLFKGVAADCTGGTQVPAANVVLFQILDDVPPDGVVADETTIQIADGSATNANPAPENPMSMGLMFDAEETYRIEFAAGATVEDIAGGSGPLELTEGTVFCFETDEVTP